MIEYMLGHNYEMLILKKKRFSSNESLGICKVKQDEGNSKEEETMTTTKKQKMDRKLIKLKADSLK